MTGIIITGHGAFATGITSALELLTGHQDFLTAVDFKQDHSEKLLRENLKSALLAFSGCDQILILCDILGGSPFKNAVTLSIADGRIRVLYGINLGMAAELAMRCMLRQTADIDALTDEMIGIGKNQIGKYVFTAVTDSGKTEERI